MFKINNGNLTGKCLISSPYMEDEHFGHSVVYICSHGKEGAMGFIINKKIEDFTFSDLASQLPLKSFAPTKDIALHQGGPLERIRGFVLHSTDYIKEDTDLIEDDADLEEIIEHMDDIPDTEDAEIERIMESENGISFDQMIGLEPIEE